MFSVIDWTDSTLLAALVALLGSVVASVVGALNSRANRRLKRQLDAAKADRAEELTQLRARVECVSEQWKIRLALYQHNWQQIVDNLRPFKDASREVIESLKKIAVEGHLLPDERVLEDSQAILKHHREFRERMKPLWGQIQQSEYTRLEAMYKYHLEIILDIAPTQQERMARAERMKAHVDRLEKESGEIRRLAEEFLQPQLEGKRQPKAALPELTPSAATDGITLEMPR